MYEQNESYLIAATELGVALSEKGVSLEDVAEIHQQSVEQLASTLPKEMLQNTAHLLSVLLLQVLKSYGLAKPSDRSSDMLLNSAFDVISGLFFLLAADGTILEFRAREEDLFLRSEEFLGKRMQDVLPAEVGEQFAEKFDELKEQGDVIEYEYSLSVPRGLRHYEGYLRALPDNERFMLVVQDISQRKFTEELYQIYFAKNILSVYWVELRNPVDITLPIAEQAALMSSEAYIKDASDSCAMMYGLSRSEVIGKPMTSIFSSNNPEALGETKKFREEFVRNNYVFSQEIGPIVNASGETKWFISNTQGIVENGLLVRYWGSQIDISATKVANAERQRLLLAVEQAAESFMITDADGKIEYINPAFERMTGYSRVELIGNSPSILKSDKHDQAFYQSMWSILQSGNSWSGRFINKKKDGTLYTEDQLISPVFDANGEIVNYVTAGRDVSHELLLEKQFQQSQKMDSIGHLAGGIAHDFNNMLGVILGYTELAKQQLPESNALNPLLDEILKAAQRSADITGQLLAFARKQTVAPQSLDLNSTVPSILNMLHRLIGEEIELIWAPGTQLWPVLIDPSQVDQILTNLCINARDALDTGGSISIETANVMLDDNFCANVPELVPGPYVKLSVIDDGKGIDAEILNNVFEPFFTTKELGSGTGLGLATVYGIVKQNGGFISAHSTAGKGSVFTIYLPRDASQARTTEPESSLEIPEFSGKTILVVEDEPALLELSSNMLKRLGYKVLAANTPELALALFDDYAGDIDLVLTDVVMPQMNGKALMDKLQAVAPHLKPLYMSGYPEDVVASKGILDEEVHFFIQKPFRQHDLAIKVGEALQVAAKAYLKSS